MTRYQRRCFAIVIVLLAIWLALNVGMLAAGWMGWLNV